PTIAVLSMYRAQRSSISRDLYRASPIKHEEDTHEYHDEHGRRERTILKAEANRARERGTPAARRYRDRLRARVDRRAGDRVTTDRQRWPAASRQRTAESSRDSHTTHPSR